MDTLTAPHHLVTPTNICIVLYTPQMTSTHSIWSHLNNNLPPSKSLLFLTLDLKKQRSRKWSKQGKTAEVQFKPGFHGSGFVFHPPLPLPMAYGFRSEYPELPSSTSLFTVPPLPEFIMQANCGPISLPFESLFKNLSQLHFCCCFLLLSEEAFQLTFKTNKHKLIHTTV